MASKSLSDQLIGAFGDEFKKFLDTDYVKTLLTIGEMTDGNRRHAHHHWKATYDVTPIFIDLFKRALTLTTDPMAKQFLDNMIKGFSVSSGQSMTEAIAKHEEVFGKIDADILDQPIPNRMIDHFVMILNELKRADFLRLMTTLLLAFCVTDATYDYIQTLPNYKANPFAKHLLFTDFGTKQITDAIKGIIDSNGANISAAKQQELIELSKHVWGFERRFHLWCD